MDVVNFCTECGHQVRLGVRFCTKCGTELTPYQSQDAPTDVGTRRRRWLVIGASCALAVGVALWFLPGVNRALNPEAPGVTSEPHSLQSQARALAGLPEAIRREVFEHARFLAPLILPLPQELTLDRERWYTEALRTSSLPPIPPSGQLRAVQPEELRHFFQAAGLIRIFELPSRIGAAPLQYFRYTEKVGPHTVAQGMSRGLKLAMREVASIDYTNQYKINPAGMGERDVFALTFSYKLGSRLPQTSPPPQTYSGHARVLRNPDTGQWQLENLGLADPQPLEYLRQAAPAIFAAFRKQQADEAERAAEAERAKLAAEEAERKAAEGRRERERAAKTVTRTIASYPFVTKQTDFSWLITKTLTIEITDVGVNLITRKVYRLDESNPVAKYLGQKQRQDEVSSESIGYWEVKSFGIEDARARSNAFRSALEDSLSGMPGVGGGGRRSSPAGTAETGGAMKNPDLCIYRSDLKSYVFLDNGWYFASWPPSADLPKVLDALIEAHRTWNERFPDRVNWHPR